MEVRPSYASKEACARTSERLDLPGQGQRAAAMGDDALRPDVAGTSRSPATAIDPRSIPPHPARAQADSQATEGASFSLATAIVAMSGSATPFFTAVTSARIDTAISGGVRLPM